MQHKGGQCRHFWREVIVRRTFSAYAGQRQNIVSEPCLFRDASAFPEEEAGARSHGAQEVHYEGCVRAAYAEVDYRDVVLRGSAHIRAETYGLYVHLPAEDVDVVVEIGEQYTLSEILQLHLGVPAEPVGHDLFFFHHSSKDIFRRIMRQI